MRAFEHGPYDLQSTRKTHLKFLSRKRADSFQISHPPFHPQSSSQLRQPTRLFAQPFVADSLSIQRATPNLPRAQSLSRPRTHLLHSLPPQHTMAMDHGRDPCPWVILNDFGGAFSMGVRPHHPCPPLAG